jgi:hypothetical protein
VLEQGAGLGDQPEGQVAPLGPGGGRGLPVPARPSRQPPSASSTPSTVSHIDRGFDPGPWYDEPPVDGPVLGVDVEDRRGAVKARRFPATRAVTTVTTVTTVAVPARRAPTVPPPPGGAGPDRGPEHAGRGHRSARLNPSRNGVGSTADSQW